MKILVVEDEPDIGLMFKMAFALNKWEVETVSERFDALFSVPRWRGVDVAIVDLMLGGDITGIQILSWLRDHMPKVIRIVYSAVAEQAHNGDVSGLAARWLQKPTTPNAVEAVIRDLMEDRDA